MNNPEITCIMKTWGDHVRLSEETVESFLRQSYPNKKLLIINTHHDPVLFEENYDNIEVIEYPYDFCHLSEKHLYALNKIETDYWCVMDDDDIYLPWYLEQMASLHKKSPQMEAWSNSHYLYSESNEIKGLRKNGTWVGYMYKKKPVLLENVMGAGWDQKILKKYYKRRIAETEGPPSWIYRWATGSHHYSGNGGEEQDNSRYRVRVNNLSLTRAWRPHWDRNYVKDAEEYMR